MYADHRKLIGMILLIDSIYIRQMYLQSGSFSQRERDIYTNCHRFKYDQVVDSLISLTYFPYSRVKMLLTF